MSGSSISFGNTKKDNWKLLSVFLAGALVATVMMSVLQVPQQMSSLNIEEQVNAPSVIPSAYAAPLTKVFVMASNNILNAKSYYTINFITSTDGIIKSIDIAFPPGYTVPGTARIIQVSGIGAGFFTISGQTWTYKVNSPVNVPAGTQIQIMMGEITNSNKPANQVAITTKDALGNIIDGPTLSNNVNLTGAAVADSSVTTTKLADEAVTSDKLGSALQLDGNVCVDNPTLCVQADNNRVGIGTATPLEKLQVGDWMTFHDGGNKVIYFNAYRNPDTGKELRINEGTAGAIRWDVNTGFFFQTAPYGAAGSQIVGWFDGVGIRETGKVKIEQGLVTKYVQVPFVIAGTNDPLNPALSGERARCPPGQVIVGGGFSVPNIHAKIFQDLSGANHTYPSLVVKSSQPALGINGEIFENGWDVVVQNHGGLTNGSVYAVCASFPGN
jgi:hypothetical protein